MFGVTVGYHRLFTHRSFDAAPAVKVVLGALGSMAIQGPILQWAATHRMHPQNSDHEGDPHSPNRGHGLKSLVRSLYHAHIGWFFAAAPVAMRRYVPDLEADKVVRWTSQMFPFWVCLGLLLPTVVAWAITGTLRRALLGFLWGGLVRVLLVQHVTWSVNSMSHLWGARPFASHDLSRNNPILGVLALGEGWHNNHQPFPRRRGTDCNGGR